jgi:hypothetical protein
MGHKRILGKTTDFITGREITDTDDERYRQKIARFLVEERGYPREDIEVKRRIELDIEGKKILSMIDFVVRVEGRSFMIVRYGPGSLVTRERPALASARVLEPYQVPVTVVTNGEDAEVIDTATGGVMSTGIASIPSRDALLKRLPDTEFAPVPPARREAEKRILSAYDWLEHSLECDDDWCSTD